MISKFKNKKTCKRLDNIHKGGSVSSAPKPKPNKTRTIKDFKKVVKAAKFATFYTQYYTEKQKQNPGKQIKKKTGRQFFDAYIKHLREKNSKVVSFDTIKALRRMRKYESQNQNQKQKHDLSNTYTKIRALLSGNQNAHLNIKDLQAKFGDKTDKTKFQEQVQKILHSPV